jgi:hypothetical protein
MTHSCPKWDYILNKEPSIYVWDASGKINAADWCDTGHDIEPKYYFKYCPYCGESLT